MVRAAAEIREAPLSGGAVLAALPAPAARLSRGPCTWRVVDPPSDCRRRAAVVFCRDARSGGRDHGLETRIVAEANEVRIDLDVI